MYCNKCGLQLPDEAIFCPECGSSVFDSSKAANAYMTSNAKVFPKKPFIPIAVAVLIIGLIVLGIWGATRIRSNGNENVQYPPMKSLLVVQEEEGVLIYSQAVKPIEVEGGLAYSLLSEDGTKACIVTKQDADYSDLDLWYCDGKKAVKVDAGIAQVWLSPAGNKIAYTVKLGNTEKYDLYVYDCASGKTSDIGGTSCNKFVFSPDGKSYAYIADQKLDDFNYFCVSSQLYVVINGGKPENLGSNQEPCGIANDGKYIYYIDHGNDLSDNVLYVQKNGEENRLTSDVQEISLLNRDCSQLLYYTDNATYITENGENGEKISSGRMQVCLPENMQYSYNLYNIKSFADQLYCVSTDAGYSLSYFDSKYNENEIEDFSGYPLYDLSEDGKSLALVMDTGKIEYFRNYRDLEKDPIVVRPEEAVLGLVISSDTSALYYVDYEATLWEVRGDAEPIDIAFDLRGNISHSADGKGIYFVSDNVTPISYDDSDVGGTLCYKDNAKGSKHVEIAEAVYYYYVSKYGVTYLTVTDYDDAAYCYLADVYYSRYGKTANSFEKVSENIQCN